MQSAYQLGPSPSPAQTWDLSCDLVSNATQLTFIDSPLFSINCPSLSNLLSGLSPNATINDVNQAIDNVIATQTYTDYPYIASTALTGNFVNSQNNTMLIVFIFSSSPDDKTIAHVQSDVKNSNMENSRNSLRNRRTCINKRRFRSVHTCSRSYHWTRHRHFPPNCRTPILGAFAALIPVLLGGISISIALASIYAAVVKIGHGTLTFLTPTLTILLMLGLAVDYSVLQLRRTREERQRGKTTGESVGLSIKWAGQAVLTAGITVIVAYIVMAVANVPIFSDVGTAIALGVAILLAASLTLLPALEIAIGDRIFWPGLSKRSKTTVDLNISKLRRIGHGTLKRKVPIIIIISIIALGAFAVVYKTPTDEEFLKLIPNFQSNQGLTALANSFGSGTISPTSIVVTTATPITYGNNQFDQVLLNQIEQISASAAASKGVSFVTGITRPFGNAFDYSALGNMSLTTQMQYESQMFSTVGKDNETTVITVSLADPGFSPAAVTSLRAMEKNINQLPLVNGVAVYYGGETQATSDSQTFMGNLIPEVVIILAAAVYVILFLQLRSAFTPIRLIITILCSVVFSLAITSAIFYYALNLPILDFAPLFVVVTMLGVGIDYDIFFLTRIREEVLNGKSDNEAIVTAIDKVWVTILGLRTCPRHGVPLAFGNKHRSPRRNQPSSRSSYPDRCYSRHSVLRAFTYGSRAKTQLVALQTLK